MRKIAIHFTIDAQGGFKIETIKGAGQSCQQVADEIGRAVGVIDDGSRKTTPEMFETVNEQEIDVTT